MESRERWLLLRECGHPHLFLETMPPWRSTRDLQRVVQSLLVMVLCFFCVCLAWREVGDPVPPSSAQVSRSGPELESNLRRHFKEYTRLNAVTRELLRDLFDKTVTGRFEGHKDFDRACREMETLLVYAKDQLEIVTVPPTFVGPRQRLLASYALMTETLNALKSGYFASGVERSRDFELAGANLQEGTQISTDSEAQMSALIQDSPQEDSPQASP
jgi:hypothetical protein